MTVIQLSGRCPLLNAKRNLPSVFDVLDISAVEWVSPFDVVGLSVLWTRSVSRGRIPSIVLPVKEEVREYLVDVGIGNIIDINLGAGSVTPVEGLWLPITKFEQSNEWDDLLNGWWPDVAPSSADARLAFGAIYMTSELVDNATTHGSSDVGTFVCIQRYTGKSSRLHSGVWIGIADGGIGIPNHLRRNPKYKSLHDDSDLIRRAREPGVTGTDDARGWGLFESFEWAAEVGPSRVLIRSGGGEGDFRVRAKLPIWARYSEMTPNLGGTWIHLRVEGT